MGLTNPAQLIPARRPVVELAYPYRAMPGRVRGLAWAIAEIDRHPQWSRRLHRHLDRVHAAFDDHVRATEGATGTYAEVVTADPRLARGVTLLAGDHQRLAAALAVLRQRAEDGAQPADLRRCGATLLVLLDRHRQRGIDLLYEAYGTDIGGET